MFLLKILRVAPDLYPYVVGGFGIHIHEMSKEQSFLGHDVSVYTAKVDLNCKNDLQINYEIYRYPVLFKLLGNSIMPSMFYEVWKSRHQYDIIHAHSHLFFTTNLCALVRKLGSSPLVITNHGLRSQTAPEWFQNAYTATGAKITFEAADAIICYTDTEKEELVSIGVEREKIKVIHNGIDTNHFVPSEKSYLENKRLLWIGRYAKGKGVEYLIEALSILKLEYPEITLTLVGKGPDKDKIVKQIKELGLEKNIILKDFILNSEIVQLYQQSSVFVLSSLEEGVPRTILEAMSCGIPVVCSRLPQLIDIVEGSGYVVPTKDPQALADSISAILSNPELAANMSAHGRQKVLNGYSWLDTVKKTISLYEELV